MQVGRVTRTSELEWHHGSLVAWAILREVRGAAGRGTAGDVPLAEHAGHLMYLVQVPAQSHTLRLWGGTPQKLFPAGHP